jgi:enoyl-CoA hydratase/carnithine racemase
VLSGRVIEAAEAAEIGLVNRVVHDAQLLLEARALAAQMAECRPEVLAAAKAALLYGERASLEDAMKSERERSAELRARKG